MAAGITQLAREFYIELERDLDLDLDLDRELFFTEYWKPPRCFLLRIRLLLLRLLLLLLLRVRFLQPHGGMVKVFFNEAKKVIYTTERFF